MTQPFDDSSAMQPPDDLPMEPGETFGRLRSSAEVWRRQAREGEPWRLHERIATGGNGEVWSATQASLDRIVAVKRLRPERIAGSASIDTSSVGTPPPASLLRAEALIAARLDHPNIVPVYELFEGADGFPQIAMKLVRGTPWHELLHRGANPMSLNEHLDILAQVAQAVAFAHSRGIVHRDLKPAQVVVGEYGEVFLMDWGLALHLPASPAEEREYLPTPQTAHNPAGTPAYMAPEQTTGSAAAIGPWTDVYLLGGILYAVLAGRPPHDAPTSHAAFYLAFRGIVPPLREVAEDREIPQELESLAMRALSIDPRQRPTSAAEFLRALRDYRNGSNRRREADARVARVRESLGASTLDYEALTKALAELEEARSLWRDHPDVRPLLERTHARYARTALESGDLALARAQVARLSAGSDASALAAEVDRTEEAQRQRERQRRTLLAASTVLLLGVGGLSSALWLTQRGRTEELRAKQVETEAARARAERARTDAEGLIDFMLTDLRERLLPIGKVVLLEEVALKSAEYFEKLPLDDAATPSSKLHQVTAMLRVAEVLRARGRFEEAMTLATRAVAFARSDEGVRPRLPAALDRLGDLLADAARYEEALQQYAESTEVLRSLPPENAEEGIPREREIAVGLTKQARMFRFLQRYPEARLALSEARPIRERLVESSPTTDTLALKDLAALHGQAAVLAEDMGDPIVARLEYEAALRATEELRRRAPEDWDTMRSLAVVLGGLGDIEFAEGDFEEALKNHLRALEASAALVAHDPENADWSFVHTWQLKRLGWTHERLGQFREALAIAEQTLAIAEEWARKNPEERRYRHDALRAYDSIGYNRYELGDAAGALAAHEAARRRLENDGGVANPELTLTAAHNVFWRARASVVLGRPEDAVSAYDSVVDAIEQLPRNRVTGTAAEYLFQRRVVLDVLRGEFEGAANIIGGLIDTGAFGVELLADREFKPVAECTDPRVQEALRAVSGAGR